MSATRLRVLVAATSVVLALSSCSEGGRGPSVSEPTAIRKGADPSLSVAAVAGEVMDVSRAPRLDPDRWQEVTRTEWPSGRPSGQAVGAFDTEGSFVLEQLIGTTEGREEGRHWVVTSGGARTEVVTPPHARRQQWAGSVLRGRWLVWKETTSFELGPEPWTLYAFDREQRRVTELARSPLIDGKEPPYVPGFTEPQILGNRVFWSQIGGTSGSERVDVYGCVIDDCAPQLISANAGFPSASDGALHVVRLDDFSRGGSRPVSMEIARIDPRSGRTVWVHDVSLRQGYTPSGLAATRDYVAWTEAATTGGDLAIVLEVATGRTWTFSAGGDGRFGDPGVGDGFIVWEGSSGASRPRVGGYLFDLRSRKVFGIGNGSARGVRAEGRYLSWMENQGRSGAAVDRLVRVKTRRD